MVAATGIDYEALRLPATPRPDSEARRHPVVIVGAGPIGLATAIDLAQNGLDVVLIEEDDHLSTGSRAICFAKRTLEIFDRLGCGEPMVRQGVGWSKGRVFHRDGQLYDFDLLPEAGHRRPAFINLQQYYVEGYLFERAKALPRLDMRWRHRVAGVKVDADGVKLDIVTPDGGYALKARYLVAADGSRSFVRKAMGLESHGQTFRDRFLIADVRMEADFPAERWFWFDPPFHPGQSALLHRQSDNVWRIDFQLGWDADPQVERQPERVLPRVRALLGKQAKFELVWASVYTFSCLRMESFRHGPVFFVGDSAHGVSPFGARGANSGVQDAENLAWKLRLALSGLAPEALLDSYGGERELAADENIKHSTRSTDFITPKSEVSRQFRDATLELARDCGFARGLVNSGRLSKPSVYAGSPLNTPDEDAFAGAMTPGAPSADAPIRRDGGEDWLLSVSGDDFALLAFSPSQQEIAALRAFSGGDIPLSVVLVAPPGAPDIAGFVRIADGGLAAERFDATPGTVYLLRPDQHIAARWRRFDAAKVAAALRRACGHAEGTRC
ncbi:MAG TPA: FAD-dependent oxidoreductase [Roseiarcus sp.]|nr:FAD-dependent oxidoreductase [Roseiarcus sp.]